MALTFQTARPEDADTIFDLCKALIDRYEDLESIDYPKVLAWVRRKIDGNIESYTCVRCDGAKAGFYRTSIENSITELDDLYILPEFRNRGIGTFIVKKVCEESEFPVMLYVFNKNTGACALYERLGFRVWEYVGSSRKIMVWSPEEWK